MVKEDTEVKFAGENLLAAQVKVLISSAISISRYETGASLPSIKTPVKIAKVLKKPAVIFWKSKAKKPKRINLHKSIDVQRKDERPIYDSFRSIFECFKA